MSYCQIQSHHWTYIWNNVYPEFRSFYFDDFIGFWSNLNLDFKLKNIAIDGVSCIGKTTSLEKYEVLKFNKFLPCTKLMNSTIIGTIGYIKEAKRLMALYNNVVWDRCFFNNLIWNVIWSFEKINSPYEQSTEDVLNFLKNAETIFKLPIFKEFLKEQSIVFCVDFADFDTFKNRMLRRNEGTDEMRSKWPMYFKIQNLIYLLFAKIWSNHVMILDFTNLNKIKRKKLLEEIIGTRNDDDIYLSDTKKIEISMPYSNSIFRTQFGPITSYRFKKYTKYSNPNNDFNRIFFE